MSYKTILLYVDASPHLALRIKALAKMATQAHAHLIGTAVTGISRSLHRRTISAHGSPQVAPDKADYLQTPWTCANVALDKFEALMDECGVTSYEKRLIDDDAAAAISMQGLYADLIVLGQSDPGTFSLTARVDFPEYVILNSECPVLILPFMPPPVGNGSIGERVLIAWNGSLAASRAVKNAMPFLRQASSVQLAIIQPTIQPHLDYEESGAEIAAYLERHQIEVEIVRRTVVADAGHTLLALASELNADMLVMGCVAHPRWRGVLLGGTTRVVLEEATVAVLMSH